MTHDVVGPLYCPGLPLCLHNSLFERGPRRIRLVLVMRIMFCSYVCFCECVSMFLLSDCHPLFFVAYQYIYRLRYCACACLLCVCTCVWWRRHPAVWPRPRASHPFSWIPPCPPARPDLWPCWRSCSLLTYTWGRLSMRTDSQCHLWLSMGVT